MPDSRLEDWQTTTLGACSVWYSGGTPDTSVDEYWKGAIPWITASSLHRFYIDDSERKITQLGLENGSRLMPANSIIFVVRGMSLKTEFRVGITKRPVAFGQDCKAIVAKEGIAPLFLANVLRSKSADILGLVDEAGHGTGRLQTEVLKAIQVPVPPLAEQHAIASILGALDDKIELNRRMNATLEAMARAIFQSWFVDFDPVRAKVEGRETGLPVEIAALFPDGFVESELGEIPEEWTVAIVGDEVQIVKGVSYRSEQLAPSDTAMVTLKSINRRGGYRIDGLKEFTGAHKPEQVVNPHELVVAQTDVTQAAEVIGRPALVSPDERYRTLVASLDILIIRPRTSDLARYFFYLMFGRPEYQDHIYGHTNGTTVLHLSRNGVPSFRYAKPPDPLGNIFGRTVAPLFERQFQNSREIRTLSTLRDTLLPRLISGQLRVPEAEELIEEAIA